MANSNSDDEIYAYLSRFFENFSADENRFVIFKNSIWDNLKLLIFVAFCGFFKFGLVGILTASVTKGFISGFTTATFVRYYAARGLLVPLASALSSIIFIPTFIIFCTVSAKFSSERKTKKSIGLFFCVCLICLTIFCVVSFFDGYVTTTFIKLLKPFIVKM